MARVVVFFSFFFSNVHPAICIRGLPPWCFLLEVLETTTHPIPRPPFFPTLHTKTGVTDGQEKEVFFFPSKVVK